MASVEIQNTNKGFCRICLDSDSLLMSPCACKGSLEFVHEDCLKKWLLCKFYDITQSKCEICKTEFNLMVRYKKKFTPCDSICNKLPIFFIILFMISFIVMMIFLFENMVCKLIDIIQNGKGNIQFVVNFLGMTVLCSILAIFSIYRVIKDECFSIKILEWRILGSVKENEESFDQFDSHTSLASINPVL